MGTPVQISTPQPPGPGRDSAEPRDPWTSVTHVALIGNPNTGKTTLFNRLCGLRHKTSNFPGTTQEARIGQIIRTDADPRRPAELIDLPGIYSLELDMNEAEICRRVLAGTLAIPGEPVQAPDAVCVVIDATNLARNLLLVGEALRRRLPTVVALNMIDLARRQGINIEPLVLEELLGCRVVLCSARSGEGVESLRVAMSKATVPNLTPPGTQDGLERWADSICERLYARSTPSPPDVLTPATTLTDRIDRIVTHPVAGVIVFVLVMTALFFSIFSVARIPMSLLDTFFGGNPDWVASWQPAWLQTMIGGGLTGIVHDALPLGLLNDFLCGAVIRGVGSTIVFLPQIMLLFFLISLLEDTGYLARAAFVMDRILRPFGLPGHSFVPLLSSHACALPGIMSCRGIPDARERLATILVAPFMTCSARLPVYVLLTGILFPKSPAYAAMAFVGCYALGAGAGVLSALLARRTILKGKHRPMALELPTYKAPSLYTAVAGTLERGRMFVRKAGTNILAICIVLWWMGNFPRTEEPPRAVEMRALAAAATDPAQAALFTSQADAASASAAKAASFIGIAGRTIQPVFAPLGFDWKITVGVLTSFAAREVFVSTMSVMVTGNEDSKRSGVLSDVANSKRDDGTPLFPRPAAWAALVFFVLAMQCLPTLAVTARETGHVKWALLQLGWMSGVAYLAAAAAHAIAASF
jgi:ferrous iron transport protein B